LASGEAEAALLPFPGQDELRTEILFTEPAGWCCLEATGDARPAPGGDV
jgi:hypothetical protein